MSAKSAKALNSEIGNQSRCGSVMPICLRTSWAMCERVALAQTAVVGDVFVAARERHRLERDEADLLRVVEREADDGADLLVIDGVDQCRHQHDLDAGLVQVVDNFEFYVKEVADLPVAVGGVADTVELQVDVTQPASAALRQNSFDLANSMPLVAAWTEL